MSRTSSAPDGSEDPRTAELRANLTALRQRLAEAESQRVVGSGSVELIVVTKFFPADDARRLLSLGVTDLGENRDQEAAAKAREVPAATWHFIGQLQSKKSNSVVRYASRVHSVDRLSLVTALGKAVRNHRIAVADAADAASDAADRGTVDTGGADNGVLAGPAATADLECLVQISLDGTVGRGGVLPQDLERVAEAIANEDGLRLRGVMAVAPLEADPDAAFEQLHAHGGSLQEQYPEADQISAGMSSDLEAAVRWGSTHVRVGSGILGARPVG